MLQAYPKNLILPDGADLILRPMNRGRTRSCTIASRVRGADSTLPTAEEKIAPHSPGITSHAPSIGPAIPSSPAATVSQIVIPVALSSFVRQLPQTVEQLWMLMEKPSQYAPIATMVMNQLWAIP